MDAAYTGNQIALRRKELGLTQKELAHRLHVTDKAVSKWERGLNFPDMGTLEPLAEALESSPIALLGLEDAGQNEIISALAQASQEQLERARRDNSITAWGCILVAVLLILAQQLFGSKEVVERQRAYQLQYSIIAVLSFYGIYLLFQYEQIRKFTFGDYAILYTGALAELIRLGYMFITGYGCPELLNWICLTVSFLCLQWLFFRVMRPRIIKLLPLLLSVAFALWNLLQGSLYPIDLLPTLCCAAVWLKVHPLQFFRGC